MSRLSSWLPWGKSSARESHLLVSVYYQESPMPQRRLSRASRRILLTTSIWSVVILVLAFFLTYTILLVLVDHPFKKAASGKTSVLGMSSVRFRPKVNFLAETNEGMNSANSSAKDLRLNHLSPIWNPKDFDDLGAIVPVCEEGPLFTVMITSSPDHFQHRTEIRMTWCDPTVSTAKQRAWQCIFLIGQTEDEAVRAQLKVESESHSDILRGTYLDSYRNLTKKVMHGLSWLSTHCKTSYVIKTDDDCFVNTLLFWQFLTHYNTQTTDLYAGSIVMNRDKLKVIRTANQKWSVSQQDYAPEYYPPYASGSGYTMSWDVVGRLVERGRFVQPIPNEDAYVGLVIDSLGVEPVMSGRFTISGHGLRLCNFMYILVAHDIPPSMQSDMHDKMVAAQKQCRQEEEVKTWF